MEEKCKDFIKTKKGRILFIIHDVYQDVNVFPLGIGYLASALKD